MPIQQIQPMPDLYESFGSGFDPMDKIKKGQIVKIPNISHYGNYKSGAVYRKWNTDMTFKQLVYLWISDEMGVPRQDVDDSLFKMYIKNTNVEMPFQLFDKWALANKHYIAVKVEEYPIVYADRFF